MKTTWLTDFISQKNRNRFAVYRAPSAFTLVATLFVVCILMGIVVLLALVVSSHQRGVTSKKTFDYARQSALFGLDIAIGELQAAAGPDQRVTATADILQTGNATASGNNTIPEGRAAWTGVWDTTNYDPTNPASKTFLRWLVSGTNGTGSFQMPTSINATATDDILIFKGASNSTSVRVPKVLIDSVPEGNRSFAFWVEDEGVKADLRWNEGNFTNTERKQAARLAVAPGPDYGRFDWPQAVAYPLATSGNGSWLTNLAKATDPADTQPILGGNATWLRDKRRDFTVGSRGVLADVENGGLRRDLSLAFEMDGTLDAPNLLTRFNSAIGEFVGTGNLNTDTKSAISFAGKTTSGLNFYSRHLYRNSISCPPMTTPQFGGNSTTLMTARGPTWHAMRDYYNLYKRVTKNGAVYQMPARAVYPNQTLQNGANVSSLDTTPSTQTFVDNYLNESSNDILNKVLKLSQETFNGKYQFFPLRGNYSPVLLGMRNIISVVGVTDSTTPPGSTILATSMDPLFYVWNPYDVILQVPSINIRFAYNGPFFISTNTTNGTSPPIAYGKNDIGQIIRANGGVATNSSLWYRLASDTNSTLSMAPGEVLVFSLKPPAGGGFVSMDSNIGSAANPMVMAPGYNILPSSGYFLKKTPYGASNATISMDANTTASIFIGYQPTASGARFQPTIYLGGANATEQGQAIQAWFSDVGMTWSDNVYTPTPNPGTQLSYSQLGVSSKRFIGQFTYLLKPTSTIPGSVWVESFARFNPLSMTHADNPSTFASPFNRFLSLTFGTNLNSLLGLNGISVDPNNRNGFWGPSYSSSGISFLPMMHIPTTPPLSLAAFRHATISWNGNEPLHQIGNSLSSPYLSGNQVVGTTSSASPFFWDASWLANDALWDRYFLSGIAPDYTINSSGYSATTNIQDSLTKFFSSTPADAKASPVLCPWLPSSTNSTSVISALNAADGYKKMAAYCLIDGAFNVNSTSVAAWAALLSANRDLEVSNLNPGSGSIATDSASGVPFPKAGLPSGSSTNLWQGFRRVTAAEIWDTKGTANPSDDTGLAVEIVKQVRLRGPFQSLSDFVNRQLSTGPTGYWGAIQAAIQAVNLNAGITSQGRTPNLSNNSTGADFISNGAPSSGTGTTAAEINGYVSQADILEPIAPRLSARSDTFRIRAYGEVRSNTGVSRSCCEAVVQRVPEYVDPTQNVPWDEGTALKTPNSQFGRRFKVVQLRWLNPDEF